MSTDYKCECSAAQKLIFPYFDAADGGKIQVN